MNRSQLMDVPHCVNDTEFVRQIAFHEAGHATAIHIRNTQEKLPPIYFQIYINHYILSLSLALIHSTEFYLKLM